MGPLNRISRNHPAYRPVKINRGGATSPGKLVAKIAWEIGADFLVYQDLDDLIAACTISEEQAHEFDTSCFTGEYCTGDITEEYLKLLELQRNDSAKNGNGDAEPEEIDSMDIHNED